MVRGLAWHRAGLDQHIRENFRIGRGVQKRNCLERFEPGARGIRAARSGSPEDERQRNMIEPVLRTPRHHSSVIHLR